MQSINQLINPTTTQSTSQTISPIFLFEKQQPIQAFFFFLSFRNAFCQYLTIDQYTAYTYSTVFSNLLAHSTHATLMPHTHTGTRVVGSPTRPRTRYRLLHVRGEAHYSTGPARLGSFHQWIRLSSRGTRGIMITGSLVNINLELSGRRQRPR